VSERSPLSPRGPDAEALLAALVLDPATYSRNRFYELFRDADLRRVRRRAAAVRSVVALLAREASASLEAVEDGAILRFEVKQLGLKRTVRLDPLEISLARYGAALAKGRVLGSGDPDRERVERVLGRLLRAVPAPASA
jgi:hypothetical protein